VVFALQLVLPGAGWACVSEWTTSVVDARERNETAGPHAAHERHDSESGESSRSGADSTPDEPAHCVSAASCAMVALMGDEIVVVPRHPVAQRTMAGDESAPRSVRHAPDPPPPRA
jgi:hypothetical protein